VSGGIRFCEAIGLQAADFDFEAAILEVARSVVKVSRQHHPRARRSWYVHVLDETGESAARRFEGLLPPL
jgi:integrase